MRRAFEPERSWPDAIESGDAEHFIDRELGVLAEQGNFEQARQKLAKRVMQRGNDAHAYLDAIRLERCAAPSGTAWEAWLARAFSQNVEIAGELLELVPHAELAVFLAKKRVGWIYLEKQRNQAAAHELMRLRLDRQLADEPESALTALEDHAFVRCAQTDPTLRRFAIGVMAGTVWLQFARVRALAPKYGVDWNAQPDAREPDAPALAQLLLAFRLRAAWATTIAEVPCPAALERFVCSAQLTSTAQTERLARELSAELRAQRREYVRCADCVVRSSPALASCWLDTIHTVRDELVVTHGASAPPAAAESAPANPRETALERRIARLRSELRSDPLQRLWLGACVVSAAGLALLGASLVLGLHAFGPLRSFGLLTGISLLPLRTVTDALLYRRNVRPVFFEAIATDGIALATLVRGMRQAAVPRRTALAARAERDAAMSLLSAITELGSAGAGRAGQVRS